MNEYPAGVPIVITHEGGMRFGAQIRSHLLVTDQPERAGGTDSGPSPIELLGASLGSCIAFYVQQFCHARNLPYEGMRVEVKQRSEKNPARVAEFIVQVVMPDVSRDQKLPRAQHSLRWSGDEHRNSSGCRSSLLTRLSPGCGNTPVVR